MEETTKPPLAVILEKTTDLVQDLKLSDLDPQWVEDIAAGDLCEIDGLPFTLNQHAKERQFFVSTLSELNSISKNWVDIEDTNSRLTFLRCYLVLTENFCHNPFGYNLCSTFSNILCCGFDY